MNIFTTYKQPIHPKTGKPEHAELVYFNNELVYNFRDNTIVKFSEAQYES